MTSLATVDATILYLSSALGLGLAITVANMKWNHLFLAILFIDGMILTAVATAFLAWPILDADWPWAPMGIGAGGWIIYWSLFSLRHWSSPSVG